MRPAPAIVLLNSPDVTIYFWYEINKILAHRLKIKRLIATEGVAPNDIMQFIKVLTTAKSCQTNHTIVIHLCQNKTSLYFNSLQQTTRK